MTINFKKDLNYLNEIYNKRKYSITKLNKTIENIKNSLYIQKGGKLNIDKLSEYLSEFQRRLNVLTTQEFKDLLFELESLTAFFEEP
jgi:hypothetical protein